MTKTRSIVTRTLNRNLVLKAITKPGIAHVTWGMDISEGVEESYMSISSGDTLKENIDDLIRKEDRGWKYTKDAISMAIIKYKDGEELFLSVYSIEEVLDSLKPMEGGEDD